MKEAKKIITTGIQLEARAQRLIFCQGYFSIRDIFIPGHDQTPGASTPDIDVLGYQFTEDFLIKKIMYDCKSGRSQAVNRVLWLQSMARHAKTDRVYIIRPDTPSDIKLYGLTEGVYFIDNFTLNRLERDYLKGMPPLAISTSPEILTVIEEINRIKEPNLKQILQVIRSEFWFLPSCAAIKRIIAKYEYIGPLNTIPGLSDLALKWLKATLINLFLVGILRICSEVNNLDQKERENLLKQRLISDKINYLEFNSIVKTTFEYAYSVYGKQAALPMGNFYEIPPPKYTESILDLITRALSQPREAIQMPRFSEYVLFEFLLLNKNIDTNFVEQIFKISYLHLQAHYRDYLFFLNTISPSTKDFLKDMFPAENK